MRYIYFLSVIIATSFVLILTACKNSSEPSETTGSIQGTVRSAGPENNTTIFPAYIFMEDSLLAITDSQGNYHIAGMISGTWSLTCSALGYRDSVKAVTVRTDKITAVDFYLSSDTIKVKLYGEFQDLLIFNNATQAKPEMEDWDPEQIYMGVTGATMHPMGMQRDLPERRVYLGDSLMTICDAWGQYWFEIQRGTYPFRGTCDGYKDDTRTIKLSTVNKNYLNFFLVQE